MALQPNQGAANIVYVTSPQAVRPDFAPDFYAGSTFRITEAKHGLAFLRAVRPDNLACVQKLSLVVEAFYAAEPPLPNNPTATPASSAAGATPAATTTTREPQLPFWEPQLTAPAWYELLATMRDRLAGLRELDVYLHAELTGYHQDVPRFGAGDDPQFARGLARLQGLNRLVLDGFFAREWPAFLERELRLDEKQQGDVGQGRNGNQGIDDERGEGETVWSARGKSATYLKLLGQYQGYLPPVDFGP